MARADQLLAGWVGRCYTHQPVPRAKGRVLLSVTSPAQKATTAARQRGFKPLSTRDQSWVGGRTPEQAVHPPGL